MILFRKYIEAEGFRKHIYDDTYLWRFLKARNFDLTKVFEMWDNF